MTGDPAKPKRSRLRRVALSLTVVLVLLVGVLVYLHTSHGFRHVIVPLVAFLTKAEVSVRDGKLSLTGMLAIDGLQFRAANQGVAVEADRVYLSMSLIPLLRGQPPVIRDLQLSATTVTLTEPELAGMRTPEPLGPEGSSKPFVLPPIIERAKVEGFSLTRLTPSGTVTVRDATMTVDHLEPGQTGAIKLAMNFSHERESPAIPVSGTATLDLALEQNSTGTAFQWNATNTVVVESGLPDPDTDHTQAVTFAQTLSGQYDRATENLHLLSSISAKKGEVSMGLTKAEVRLEGKKEQQPLQATVDIEGLTGEALTMLLMGISPAQFASGRIDGRIQVNRLGELVGIRAAVAGHRLSLRHAAQATPPVNIKVDQVGSFNQGTRALSLETFSMSVSDGTRRLVTATLERPVVMNLASHSSQVSQESARESNGSTQSDLPAVGLKLGLHGLTTRDLRPWLALSGEDPFAGLTDGELSGTGDLTVLNDGRVLDLSGRLSFTKVMVEGDRRAGTLGPLAMQNETHATLTDFAALRVEQCTTSVSLNTKQVARVVASGTMQVGKPAKIQSLEGTITLDGLPLEAMNPLLATRGSARVQRAVLDGGGTVHVGGDRIAWDMKVQGSQVSFRLPDMASPTPPLEVHLNQTGSLDQTSQTLRLEELAIQVLEDRRPVIVGTLDKPLALHLSRREGQSGDAAESTPVTLTLEVSQLGVRQIRPWMALTGQSLLDHVRSGQVNGRFQVNVRGGADQINLDGNLDLTEFQLERRGSHVVAAPVTIRSRLRAGINGLTQVKLDSSTVQVSAGQQSLAEFSGAGMVDGKSGTADVKVQIASANLVETLDRLGFLTPKQRRLIEGGDFKSNNTVVASGPNQPLQIKTDLRLDKLTVRLDSQHSRIHSLTGQGMVVVSGDRSEARFDQVGMKLLANGTPSGTFTLAGRWPFSGGAASAAPKAVQRQPGELTITAKDWDASMPVSFFDILPGREPGPLPVSVQIMISQDPAQQAMMVRGHESIGPLRPVKKDKAGDPGTVQLDHELTRQGDEVRVAALTLSVERPHGHADRVTLAGGLHLEKRPRIQARGKVEALDAGWFADLLTDPGKPEQAEGAVIAAAAPMAPAHTGKGFPADLDVEIEIGSLSYRGLKVEQGRLIARGTGGNLHTTLSPTKMAGGTVEATAGVTMVQGEPQTKWSARGQQLAIEALLQAAASDGEAAVTGLASFTTAGTGRGSGETLKGTLTGTASFDLTQGRFVKSDLLAFIAKQTQIKEIEHMGFDSVHGDLQVKEGWVQLDRVHVVSPAIVLDAVGRVGLDGKLDVKVSPRVSAGLAQKSGGACFAPLLHTVDGLTVFPFAVVVKGTTQQPAYGMELRAEEALAKNMGLLAGGILKTLEGCGGKPVESGAEAVDALKGAAQGLFDSLLGGSKKRQSQ